VANSEGVHSFPFVVTLIHCVPESKLTKNHIYRAWTPARGRRDSFHLSLFELLQSCIFVRGRVSLIFLAFVTHNNLSALPFQEELCVFSFNTIGCCSFKWPILLESFSEQTKV